MDSHCGQVLAGLRGFIIVLLDFLRCTASASIEAVRHRVAGKIQHQAAFLAQVRRRPRPTCW